MNSSSHSKVILLVWNNEHSKIVSGLNVGQPLDTMRVTPIDALKIDYDEVLKCIGQFGKYHAAIHFLLWLPSMLTGLTVVAFSFTGFVPAYRCRIPYCDTQPGSTFYQSVESKTFPDYVSSIIPSTSLRSNENCQILRPIPETEVNSCQEYVNAVSDGAAYLDNCNAEEHPLFYDDR